MPDPSPVYREENRTLGDLFQRCHEAELPAELRSLAVTGITARAQDVTPGAVFVAIRGTRVDGHEFIPEALRRGAAAVVAEREAPDAGHVPVVRSRATRRTLGRLAAAWHRYPAERMRLVGITGTAGKTSTLAALESVLAAAGRRVGSIGSMGLRQMGKTLEETGYTAPDPLLLQAELARLAAGGCELVVMEATSHALDQERLVGVQFDLGIFTNLLPLEHSEYHAGFRDYAETKRRFFGLLREGAPVIYNLDDPIVRRFVRGAAIQPIAVGTGRAARVRMRPRSVTAEGTALELRLRPGLDSLEGTRLHPARIPLRLCLLGRANLSNVSLAAAAALVLGVPVREVARAARDIPTPRRRMEILHRGAFTILDDTVGHPDSISSVFLLARSLAPRRLHLAFAVRGQRGEKINRENGRTLAIWSEQMPVATLVVTRSVGAADDRNRVDDNEARAFTEALRQRAISFDELPRLDEAVRYVLGRAAPGDLVLLLGAQGMDRGRDVANVWLRAHSAVAPA